jgi:hypothetical protein
MSPMSYSLLPLRGAGSTYKTRRMNPTTAASFYDRQTNVLDAGRMRAAGIVALCRPDVMDGDSFNALIDALGGRPGPFFIAGARYGEPFAPPVRAPIPELAMVISHELEFRHRLFVVSDVWACFQPDEGEYHVLFGEAAALRGRLRALVPETNAEWAELYTLPAISDTTKRFLAEMRRRYTFGLGDES